MFAQDILFKDLEIFSLFHRPSSSTIHQNQPYHRKLNPLMFVDRIGKERMLKCNVRHECSPLLLLKKQQILVTFQPI